MANLNEVYYDGVPEIRVSGWELASIKATKSLECEGEKLASSFSFLIGVLLQHLVSR
jgi:hypothetical protein